MTASPVSNRIALFLITAHNEYQQELKEDARRACARVGLELDVFFAENDAAAQVRQIYECIRNEAWRPRAVVVFPVREGSLYRVGHDAGRAGVGWVVLNRRGTYVHDLQREFPDLPFAVVGPDQVEAGRVQARQARALLPAGRSLLLYVMGPAVNYAAQDRLTGLQEGLVGTSVEVSRVYGNWSTPDSEVTVAAWLRLVLQGGARPTLVAAQNDAMAIGASNVLTRLSREMAQPELAKVPVTGIDGCVSARALVDQGQLAATIIQPASSAVAVGLLSRAFAGERQPTETVLPVRSYPELARLGLRPRAAL